MTSLLRRVSAGYKYYVFSRLLGFSSISNGLRGLRYSWQTIVSEIDTIGVL